LIEIYRITFETEKIVELVLEKRPSTVELGHDASVCIVCFDDGEIELYKVEQMSQILSIIAEPTNKLHYVPLSGCQSNQTNTTGIQLSDIDPKTSDQVKNQFQLNNFLLFACETAGVLSVYFNARIKLLQYPLNTNSRVQKILNF
jgi:hypothetical protein